jgi:hypothetical protein
MDADVRNVLRVLADVSKKNIVIAEDVKGKVTVKLDNVSHDEALDVILKNNDLAKIERKRPGKGSNDDWAHPNDPDARITKMKDGRTHLAYKAEHAVDMQTGALLG